MGKKRAKESELITNDINACFGNAYCCAFLSYYQMHMNQG